MFELFVDCGHSGFMASAMLNFWIFDLLRSSFVCVRKSLLSPDNEFERFNSGARLRFLWGGYILS